jgi:hypothetical protein
MTTTIENTLPYKMNFPHFTPKAESKIVENSEYILLQNLQNVEEAKYKSIILRNDEIDPVVLSISPTIPLDPENFKEKYPTIENMSDFYVSEMVEGTTMILFYDDKSNKWEIATKNAIGGNYWYYRTQYIINGETIGHEQMTFREMFIQALGFDNYKTTDINDIPSIRQLSPKYCYHFIFQHPLNHIVMEIREPKVYLISVYEIEKGGVRQHVSPAVFKTWESLYKENGESTFHFPVQLSFTNYVEIPPFISTNYRCVGVTVLHVENGEYALFENTMYTQLRELRGNNPNLLFHFLELLQRRNYDLESFKLTFPRYSQLFDCFYFKYSAFIQKLYGYYVSHYIKKSTEIIPKPFFVHLWKIHNEIYKPTKKSIQLKIVDDYFLNLSTSALFYLINL